MPPSVTAPFRPLGDRVLLRRIDSESVTAGGIIIPDAHREKLNRGELVACGPDMPADFAVELGAEVLFGRWSGDVVSFESHPGVEFLTLRATDLFGYFDDGDQEDRP